MSPSDTNGDQPVTASPAICGSIIAVLAAAYFCLFVSGIPNPGDLDVAFPIALELAEPGLHAENDLLVQSGKRVPFHLYRLAGRLYSAGHDVEALWFVLYLLLLIATFYGVFRLAHVVSGSLVVSAVCVGLIAAMRYLRGALHWSNVPQNGMVTSHVAIPIVLFGLVCIFQRRYLMGLILGAATFYVHPYTGLLALLASTAALLFGAGGTPMRKRLTWLVITGLLCVPNAISILIALPDNFGIGASGSSADSFIDIFRIYAWHAYPEDHWHEGYAWVFINLAGIVFFARYLRADHRRQTAAIIFAMIAAMAIYALNLYTVQVKSLLLAFLFRATYITKPLMIVVVTSGCFAWWREQVHSRNRAAFRYSIACGFVLAAFTPYVRAAAGIGLITYAALLWSASSRRWQRVVAGAGGTIGFTVLALFLGVLSSGEHGLPPRIDLFSVVAMCVSALAFALASAALARVRPIAPPAQTTSRKPVACLVAVMLLRVICEFAWMPGSARFAPVSIAELAQRIRFTEPTRSIRGAALWIRSNAPRGSMVAVPPVFHRFSGFRLKSQRSVYITMHDINQLSFDTAVYAAGHRRLLSLGVRVRGRHDLDESGYYRLGIQQLAGLYHTEGVDYAIFDVRGVNAELAGVPPVYRDGTYAIFDLERVAASPATNRSGAPAPERGRAETDR